jgi:hypothetical protein
MMAAAQIPDDERFKLWPEAAVTAKFLNNLVPVSIRDVTHTRWKHAGYQLPSWAKNLCTFGKDGIVKEGKEGKVLDRGLTMMFVGYSGNHAESVFKMYSPEISRIVQTQDLIWIGQMFHTRRNADITQQLPIVTVPISIHDATDDAEIQKLEVGTFPVSEERGEESNSSEAAPFTIISKTRYGHATGRKDSAYNPSTETTIKWSDVVATEVVDAEYLVTNYYEGYLGSIRTKSRCYRCIMTVSPNTSTLELVLAVGS